MMMWVESPSGTQALSWAKVLAPPHHSQHFWTPRNRQVMSFGTKQIAQAKIKIDETLVGLMMGVLIHGISFNRIPSPMVEARISFPNDQKNCLYSQEMSSGFFVVSLKSWLKFNDPSQTQRWLDSLQSFHFKILKVNRPNFSSSKSIHQYQVA